MKKSKGIVVLLLTLILTVFFCFTAAVGITSIFMVLFTINQ